MKWHDSLWLDVRHGVRTLSRRPKSTLISIGLLGVGIGLTTGMFTVADALVLRPAPFKEPQQLAFVYMGNERGGRTTVAASVLQAWQRTPGLLGAEGAVVETALVKAPAEEVVEREVALVTPGLFHLLGDVAPIVGRVPDWSVRNRDGREALISEHMWRSLFNADVGVIGKLIVVADEPLTIIGVLPGSFRFPSSEAAIWRVVDFDAPPPSVSGRHPMVYVRFNPAVPLEDIVRTATTAAQDADRTNENLRLRVEPLNLRVTNLYTQRAMPMLTIGVVLVFIIICVNVGSISLARLLACRRELGVRAALGASRGRLMLQAGTETVVVGLLGLLAGVAVAWILVNLSRVWLPAAFLLQTLNPLDIDRRALMFSAASGLVAVALAGVLPLLLTSRTGADWLLRMANQGASDTRRVRAVVLAMLSVEFGVACALLVCAVVLTRSFSNLASTDLGFEAERTLVATVSMPSGALPDTKSREAVALAIAEQLDRLEDVQQVTASYGAPPRGGAVSFGLWRSDTPDATAADMAVDRYSVRPDFFDLYGIPLLRGRLLERSDPPEVVVVGERFAERVWPGLDAVGRSFKYQQEVFRVVGIAREINNPTLDEKLDKPEFYESMHNLGSQISMSMKCGNNCPSSAQVRQSIQTASPFVTTREVRRLSDVYREQLSRPRATAALGMLFAIVSVLAAAGGLFGSASYIVGLRTREFGLRAALGASPAQIRTTVLRDSFVVVMIGVGLGAIAAWPLERVLSSLQHKVAVSDPMTWVIAFSLLGIVAITASWSPAQRALSSDPALLLRQTSD